MRTIQKKLKFSKGQIDERLLERQDLDILDSSASTITNFISTPYGSLKNRQGTLGIDGFEELAEIDTITNSVGSSGYSFNEATVKAGGFYQTGDLSSLSDDSEIIRLDFGLERKLYELGLSMCFFGKNIYGDVGTFFVTQTDGVINSIYGANFQNIKTPVVTSYSTDLFVTKIENATMTITESGVGAGAVFTEDSVGKTIFFNEMLRSVLITEYVSPTEVKSETIADISLLSSTSWIYEETTYTTTLTITDVIGDLTVRTDDETIFVTDQEHNFIKIGTDYCVINSNSVDTAIVTSNWGISATTYATWDFIESTRLNVIGRTAEATGAGAIVAIPYTEFDGDIPSGYLHIVSGGSGYIDSTFLYTAEATEDSLLSSTATLQKSDNGTDWTDVEVLTITNSLLGGNTQKIVTVNDNIQCLRVISDAVRGRYYIGNIEPLVNEYGSLRLEPFIVNDEEEYLVIFSKNLITIYDGIGFTRLSVDLTERQIQELKYSQKDDVMVITHTDFSPLQLVKGLTELSILPILGVGDTTSGGYDFSSLVSTDVYLSCDNNFNSSYSNHSGIETQITYNDTLPTTPYNDYIIVDFPTTKDITSAILTVAYCKDMVVQKKKGATYTTVQTLGVYENKSTFKIDINDSIDGIKIVIPTWYKRIARTSTTTSVGGISITIYTNTWEVTGGRVHEIEIFDKVVSEWTVSTMVLRNIPKYNFDGDVTTAKTSTITPDTTDGLVTITSSASDFTTASVGQFIDGGGGRAKITEYVSGTKVRGITIIPFYTIDPFSTWNYITGYESVWSDTRSYPNTCLFYQGRLWFGGTKYRLGTIWGSRVNDFNNFLNVGNYSNDAIDVTISGNQPVEILELYPNRGIQVFCSGSEWIIPEGNLTPDGISITRNTANGIKRGIRPVDIAGVTMFIEKNGKSLLSFVYDLSQNAYATSLLSRLTPLINNAVDMDVTYNSTQNEANYLYVVNSDGSMAVACMILDQKINSYVKFVTTDGLFKSVCVVGDDVFVVVTRDTGTFIEKFEADVLVDNRRLPVSVSLIEGGQVLVTIDSKFIGQSLQFYMGEQDLGIAVTNGSAQVLLSYTGTYQQIYYGTPIYYELISNKIAVNGQTGSIIKRISEAIIETLNTLRVTFCGQTLRNKDTYQFNGVTSPDRDPRFTITGNFYPIEVLSILLRINYGSR